VTRNIIVMGASAGGVKALGQVLTGLTRSLKASVFVVCHTAADGPSLLAKVLSRSTQLPVDFATHGAAIEPGTIRVAPPDRHLLLQNDRVLLSRGPKHNRARPAIDPLFRSAAEVYGPRVIGVVLSGLLDDGAAGLLAIKRQQGLAIVQDPADAQYPDMPNAALSAASVDHRVPADQIGPLLTQLSSEGLTLPKPVVSQQLHLEGRSDIGEAVAMEKLGKPSGYTCPECAGALWEVDDRELLRFRCRVGHGFSTAGLASEQRKLSEDTLWAAIRALEESASFARRLAETFRSKDLSAAADEYERRAARDSTYAEKITRAMTEVDE
jgi:two-component system chemotaxis response regulator CheB